MSFILLPAALKPNNTTGDVVANFVFLRDYLGTKLRRKWDHYVVFTPKGFMNNDAFLLCVKKTIQIWNEKNPGLRALFLGDNLESHRTKEVLLEIAQSKHLSWYIPAKTSNLLAMPDDMLFKNLKRDSQRDIEESMWDAMVVNEEYKWAILSSYLETEQTAFTPQVCATGFDNVGIVDKVTGRFNLDKVKAKIEANLGPFEARGNETEEKAIIATSAILDKAQNNNKKKVNKKMMHLYYD